MSFKKSLSVILSVAVVNFSLLARAEDTNRVVVMISIDGLAAYYMDDPQAQMTTLNGLAADGARATMMKASTPTVTWPNHTTLVTGDNPMHHGVVGNNYYDRATGKKVVLITDPVYDKDQIVKVPTIYDVCHEDGMKTASIWWPATRNAHSLDWTIPTVKTKALLEKYTTPALVTECERAGVAIPGLTESNEKAGAENQSADDGWTQIFDLILHEDKPQFGLLHVANVDHTEHMHGPKSPEAYAAVKAADNQVRQVWDELKKDYPGRATLVIVSDHGFSEVKRTVSPTVILRNAGIDVDQGADVRTVSQGGCYFIYILDQSKRAEMAKKIAKVFKGVEGVEKVVTTRELKKYGVATPDQDPHAPDMLLFADEGYSFGDTAAGALPFADKPEKSGSHGHDSSLPDLHATFVAWGAGIKHGVKLGEISNTDVAPTLAKILGVNLPHTDGKPLQKILSN
jgi:predicted AlkP superfamily pyrophosphatase or phosphodiesterase